MLAIATGTRCDGVRSLDAVKWETYPSVDAAGRLTMSGRVEGDMPSIKDARKAVDGSKHPAFIFYSLTQRSGVDSLKSVGRIWPEDIAHRLSGQGTPNALADVYEVTATSFDVSAIIPSAILAHDGLYVSVWSSLVEADPNAKGSTATLGSCKVWR